LAIICSIVTTRRIGLAATSTPLRLDEANAGNQTEAEARDLIEKCMRVMFYRDKKAIDNLQITTVTANGVTEHEPYRFDSEWNLDWYRNQTNEHFRPARVRI